MLTDSEKRLPFPEAIDRQDVPDRFTITPGSESRTDLTHGVMVIDAGGPCEKCEIDHARATRLHEMGHVAWTPADWQKRSERAKDAPPPWLVNAVEDARLTRLRVLNRLERSPAILCEADGDYDRSLHGLVKSGDLLGVAAVVAAAYGSADQHGITKAISKVMTEFYKKEQHAEAEALDAVVRVVDYAIGERIYPHAKPTFRSSLAAARDILLGTEQVLADYKDAKAVDKDAKATVIRPGKKPKSLVPKNTWGKLNIVEPPLTRQSPLGMERRFTARDEGPIPTRFDRWSIDKRIFRTKKRVKGAAILVDVSGSMSWEEEDLRRVLEEVPAATVALYSGHGETGDLVIVAKKGRRALWNVVRRYIHGGNVVDGPALEWLAEQPQEVKIWMSDGGTTGPYDSADEDRQREDMERDVRRQVRRGRIMRVLTPEQVMKVLTGKQKFVPDRDFHHPWG